MENNLNLKNNSSVSIKPLIKLLLKYYYKGFFTPFFIVIYPIIILFIQGFAYKTIIGPNGQPMIDSLVPGIAVVQLITVGLFTIPVTIIEFKNSVVLKRIGATNIKPAYFVATVILIGFVISVFALFWTLLWAGIMFGSATDKGWSLAFSPNLFKALPFALLTLILSMALGMALAALLKTEAGVMAVSNIIFLPAAFLSGSFIPYSVISQSSVLSAVSYIMPFRYTVWPFMDIWEKGYANGDYILLVNILASVGFIAILGSIAIWKLRWKE